MPQVLNLRKKIKPASEVRPAPKALKTVSQSPAPTPQPQTKTKPEYPSQISWEAPSFYFNPEKKYLSLVIIALALGGGSMLFLGGDLLTAIFLLLSSLVLILYSTKKPEITRISLNQRGVEVGDSMYFYKDLKSFWIHYDPGSFKELSLESKKWFIPHIKISIEKNNPLVLRSLLINYLSEKEHEHSIVDIVARKIGL